MSGGVSDPRNAILFKMFALIDLGERAGSGIPTIIDGWQSAYGEMPTWEDTHNPDRTILKLHCKVLSGVLFEKSKEDDTVNGDKGTANGDETAINQRSGDKTAINDNSGDKSGDKMQMILEYIVKHTEVKTSDIMQAFGLKASRSRLYLSTLVEQGKIEACGSNKNRTYKAK